MKFVKSREFVLLMVPVIAIGGVGWWKSISGGLAVPQFANPLDPGPMRIEYSPFKEVNLSPYEASNGYTWKVQSTYRFVGSQALPSTWAAASPEHGLSAGNVRIEFKKGKVWKVVNPGHQTVGTGVINFDGISFSANLKDVPQDADEVRLRGRIEGQRYYNGTIPTGWVMPRNVTSLKAPLPGSFYQHTVFVASKPFDLLIQGPGQPQPNPNISKTKKIQLRDVKWFRWKDSNGSHQEILLHLRHLDKKTADAQVNLAPWAFHSPKFTVFDAKNREVFLYYKNGAGRRCYDLQLQSSRQNGFSPALAVSDLIATLLEPDVAPRNGWEAYKGGLRFEFELTDGTCWPTKIRLSLRSEPSSEKALRKFGNPANVLGSNGMEL